jgi:glutathione S-transferase
MNIENNSSYRYLEEKSIDIFLPSRRKDKRIILNTLPISHYVEKARWCLDKSGIQYEEEKDIGIFGVLTTGRMVPTLRVPGKNISISNSSDILRYLYGHLLGTDPDKAMFLKPTAESLEWESKFDKMGVDIRRYAYYHVMNEFISTQTITKIVFLGSCQY